MNLPGIQGLVIAILVVVIVLLLIILQHKRIVHNELRDKNDQLDQQFEKMQERMKLLEEQNLSLRELNEEKNNIISVVSHDLKAPLNRIFALSNLLYLSSENLSEEQRDYMDKMTIVVREGLSLIRNLLDIRTIEYKGILMNLEEVDLVRTIDDLVNTYRIYLQNKEQMIMTDNQHEGPILIKSDLQYINRIFDNLLSNAVKFSPKKSTITIEMRKNGENAIVKVLDQGPGVRVEDQSKLFEKFQILSARPTGGESSSGLGLSISKTLVDILGGKIYYDKSQEMGAAFVVELPIHSSMPES